MDLTCLYLFSNLLPLPLRLLTTFLIHPFFSLWLACCFIKFTKTNKIPDFYFCLSFTVSFFLPIICPFPWFVIMSRYKRNHLLLLLLHHKVSDIPFFFLSFKFTYSCFFQNASWYNLLFLMSVIDQGWLICMGHFTFIANLWLKTMYISFIVHISIRLSSQLRSRCSICYVYAFRQCRIL